MLTGVCVAGLFVQPESAAVVGLAISITLGMYALFNWGLSVKAMIDAAMPNVERIRQFTLIEPVRLILFFLFAFRFASVVHARF